MKFYLISPKRIKSVKKHIKSNIKLIDNVLGTEKYCLEINKKNSLKMSGFLSEDEFRIIREDKKRLKTISEAVSALSKTLQKIKINKREYFISTSESKKNFNTLYRSVLKFKGSFEKVFKISSLMN